MPSRRRADVGFGVTDLAACRAEALSKTYGRRDTAVHALREITLSIPSHAFTAIMGPSGSGKSTLLHCLAALDTPTSGRVFLGQTELTSLSKRQQAQVRRDRIGFVFQAFNLVPTLDAIENITLPQLLAGRRPNKEWLEYVVAQIGLRDRLHHRPSQLSGGQQQRVALARALAGRPEVIFADEPTGNLDTKASREMLSLLRSAVDDFRQTVVTVTHDPAIAGYADQVLFFTDGQVVDQVLHPEQDLVLEHLQYLDSSTPAHAGPRRQLRASMQQDGQHIMRSRRRRRADETGPGRPMVGDDDEVEVARQERWLQRIREQFDAEHDATQTSNGYGTGDVSPETGNGYHPEPAYDTHNGYPPDGYAPAATNGFHAASPPQTTGNGFPADGHHTGNGFQSPAQHTGNGYHPEPAHGSQNGHSETQHIAADTYQSPAHDTGNGYHPEPAYETRNGHTADSAGDDGWLPAERSWISDNGTAGIQEAGTGQQQWSDHPVHAADEYPVHRSPEPAHGSQHWESDGWDSSEQTQRWSPRTSADVAPAEQPPPAPPARSWREERSHEPADDVWSTPSTTSDGEWATIPPPTSPSASSPGQWDTSAPPEQNGWSSQPLARHEPADPPARNGHDAGGGWQRWDPDPYVTHGNGADPALSAHQGNGYHGNGDAPAHSAEPHAQSNGSAPDRAPAQPASNGAHHLSRHDDRSPEQASSDGWRAPVDSPVSHGDHSEVQLRRTDNQAGWSDDRSDPFASRETRAGAPDEPRPSDPFASRETGPGAAEEPRPSDSHRVEDPVRELLDIWSPTATDGDGWQQDSAPPSEPAPAPADPPHYGDGSNEPAVSGDRDQWQVTDGWGSSGENGHHTTGGWEPADQWQVDYTPGANHEPRELPPEQLSPPSTSSTTDPFEALHSLQSQLNRLGGGRRAPRRYGD